MSDKVIATLKVALADSYVLFLKTHNYHWNVTGPNFKSLHIMFEEQYNDLFAAIDLLAERIRALGDLAPGSFAEYKKITDLKEGNSKLKSSQMVEDLAKDQKQIVKTLYEVVKASRKCGDEVTLSMVASRIEVHEKNAWMLRSSLQ